MARKKLIHVHSNVYEGGAPKAPTAANLEKGEIAINYNDTEPAMFVKNESGSIVKFNAVQRSEITGINNRIDGVTGDVATIKSEKVNLNGTNIVLSANTPTFYAPTASGASNTVLVSDGASKSPKWVAQSDLSVGSASTAGKTTGKLTLKQSDGTTAVEFDGSASSSVTLTATMVGAAASRHTHAGSDIDKATTGTTGVVKVGNFLDINTTDGTLSVATGTSSSTVAVGNHTHSYAGSDSAGGAANSTKGTLTVNGTAFNGSADTTVNITVESISAATKQHSHTISDIPAASTVTNDTTKVPTSSAVKSYVDGLVASPVNYRGAITNGTLPSSAKVGDLYIVQTSPINLTATQSATGVAQTAEVGDYIIARTTSTWDVIQKNITGAVTSSEALTDGNFVIGGGGQTVKASSYSPSSFAASAHSHAGTDVSAATSSTRGTVKPGSFLSVDTAGALSVSTGTTSATVARGDHSHTLPTAATDTMGIMKVGSFLTASSGVVSVSTGTTSSTVARGDHDHSGVYAPASHTHLYAGSASAGGDAYNSDKVDGYHVSVVASMPSSPAADTIYILK